MPSKKLTKLAEWFLVGILVMFALFFRINRLEGRLTFEWDQERDIQAVESMVTTGTPALLGPIVRGNAGGFYLGPLYYYLITPLYLSSGGNPLSLAVVSIGADLLLIPLLYFFLRSRTSPFAAFVVSLIWAGSPLIIHNAYTPWNVSLIPLWSLFYLWTIERLHLSGRLRHLVLLVFLSSVTTSIHVSLIPIAALVLLINWRHFLALRPRAYLYLISANILPISTLIFHDLTHRFENTILLKSFLFGVGGNPTSLGQILPLIFEKFGYTIGRLFTGEPYTALGIIVVAVVMLVGFIKYRQSTVVKYNLITIIALLFSLMVYRNLDFAEYYFLPTFVSILILLAYFCASIPKIIRLFIPVVFIVYYFQLGFAARASSISPYSLTVKRQVLTEVKSLTYPVEIRTNLPRERNTGFTYLMKDMGINSDSGSSRKAYIYEAKNMEIISPPEARSIILDKPIQAFKLIVFSN
ncbi:MAG: hypothetical protein ABII21_04260 [bacterium]